MSDAWKQWEGHVVDGRFPLREFQGSTDHSAVFVTTFGSMQEKAALKLLPLPSGGERPSLARWERAAKLAHPHLLRLYAWGVCKLGDTQFLYVVSEFADEHLGQILPSRPLTAQETEFMLRSTLEVLGYLHSAGLAHAGLKPVNLMAVGDSLKLTSDDICTAGDRSGISRLPSVYDAPELAATGPSPAADVWSLGVTLVEALTQKVSPGAAFRDGDALLPADTPANLIEITRQCLRLDPARRWTTQEIAARLLPTQQPAKSRPPYVAAVVAVLALGVIVAAGKLFWRQPQSGGSPAPRPSSVSSVGATESHPADNKSAASIAPSSLKPAGANAAAKSSRGKTPEALSKAVPGAVREKSLPRVSSRSLDTISGKIRVSVKLAVDSSGHVTEASLASPGPSHYFARVALEAAKGWTFTPPMRSGEAVPSSWMLRFAFTKKGIDVQPAQLSP
jgi:TonB family protein